MVYVFKKLDSIDINQTTPHPHIDGNASKPQIKIFDKNKIFTEMYF